MTSKPMTGAPRKPTQVAVAQSGIVRTVTALCEDGTVWCGTEAGMGWSWERLPPIPGDDP